MNNNYYVIFNFDNEHKLIFIEKHQKDDTILRVGTYQEMEAYAQSLGCEVVDISSWEYENYEDKCLQVRNYLHHSKRR